MAAARDLRLVTDRALGDNARRGDRAAFDELYRRHAPAAWRLALAVARHPDAARAAVASAFALTLGRVGELEHRGDERLRIAILRATRRAAADAVTPLITLRPDDSTFDLVAGEPRVALVRQSFEALPERWRSILWLADVEGCALADAARVLEVQPAAAASLLARARLGMQEQVLLSAQSGPTPAECRRTADRLTGYATAELEERDEARVRKHLDTCAACRDRLAALDDLIPVLRTTAVVVPLALAQDAAAAWSSALVRDRGPLGLGLPGGQPVPVWAQRALAGAVAALVALGITGATLSTNRKGGGGRDVATRPVAVAGETALGDSGLSDLVLDVPRTVMLAGPTGLGAIPAPAARSNQRDPLPRTTLADTSSGPTAGGSITAPPQAPPVDSGGSTTDDALATLGIGGVGAVSVGGSCNGGQLFGQEMGCQPAPSNDPVSIGGSLGSTLLGG